MGQFFQGTKAWLQSKHLSVGFGLSRFNLLLAEVDAEKRRGRKTVGVSGDRGREGELDGHAWEKNRWIRKLKMTPLLRPREKWAIQSVNLVKAIEYGETKNNKEGTGTSPGVRNPHKKAML